MRDFIGRHPVTGFIAAAYALSWACWIPLAFRGALVIPGGSITHFPGLLGPAAAAVLMTGLTEGWPGVVRLSRRLILVSAPAGRFWLYSLSPLLFLTLAIVLAAGGGVLPEHRAFWRYSGLPDSFSLPVVLLLVLLFNGFGEEIGWRGYLLERLQRRFGPLGGALVLGGVWAGWHVPTFWTVEGYRSLPIPMLIGGFGLGILAGSTVLARVANRTGGSILAAALWHSTYNMSSATSASRGLVGMVTTTCVMVWAALLITRELRRRAEPSLLLAPTAT